MHIGVNKVRRLPVVPLSSYSPYDIKCWTRVAAMATVFVRLLGEGVDVWAPVPAVALGNGLYRVLPTENYDPELETWQLVPGVTVECETRSESGQRRLLATRQL